MNKIGIGVCTYNRADVLADCLARIQEYSNPKSKIIVADDGSTDHTLDVIKSFKMEYISKMNQGQIRNKNRLLKALFDYDHIFIIEDDLFLSAKGWEELYIRAKELSGINHFTFSPPGRYGKCTATSSFKDILIQHTEMDGGAFAYYSKAVIEKCGGYCHEFEGYGWGHCEFSERIFRAGLAGKYKNNHIKTARAHMVLAKTKPVVPMIDRVDSAERNHKIWDRSCTEGWIKCPLK